MFVARKPDDDRVEIRLSQLRELLEVLIANDVDTAKMWLMAAIRQGKEDLRKGK
jgi:hypothetical protein